MDQSYDTWKQSLAGLSDAEISHKIKDRLMESPEMNDESKRLFSDTYDFIEKNALKNKEFDLDLLKIYLTEVKGYDLSRVNIFDTLMLISFCGLNLKTKS